MWSFDEGRAILAVILTVMACACSAQVPERMNYQVMLTDGADQPMANQTVGVVFRVYGQESGGSSLWTEPQSVTTNSIGVASVILGSVNPLDIEFTAPRWFEIEVEGEVLTPRRELVASPYARQAHNSANLGGEPATSYALSEALSMSGTVNNPGNPVDWTRLKSVPDGFADGVDNEGGGVGDGWSLDASDGTPVDALYVEEDGDVVVRSALPFGGQVQVAGAHNQIGIHVTCDSHIANAAGVVAVSDSTCGLVGNAGYDLGTYTTPFGSYGVAGLSTGSAGGGYFQAAGAGHGVECTAHGIGCALYAYGLGSGYAGYFRNGSGVLMERDSGFPVLQVESESTSLWGDAAYFYSRSGVQSTTWTIYSECYEGNAARFEKNTDDNEYAVAIYGADASAEGLYVGGSIFTTAPAALRVETSRGAEAVFGVTSSDVSILSSGMGLLSGGAARVEFDRLFAESVSGSGDIRVTATPVGAWSALYVERVDDRGFELRSGAGEKDVEFHWMAVGKARGYQESPRPAIPDAVADEAVARQKSEAIAGQRASLAPERQQHAPRAPELGDD